ncbi:MAG: hypothetical protein WC966_10915 [Bradymonadales bacterium]
MLSRYTHIAFGLIVLCLFCASTKVFAQNEKHASESEASTCLLDIQRLSPERIEPKLWENFELLYEVQYKSDCRLKYEIARLPSSGISCTNVEHKSSEGDSSFSDQLKLSCKLERPGYYFPQPLELSLYNEAESKSLTLTLPKTKVGHPLEPYVEDKSAFKEPPFIAWPKTLSLSYAIAVLFILGLIVAGIIYYAKRQKSTQSAARDMLSPEDRVRSRLNQLKDRHCSSAREFKAFYDELSHILRSYLHEKLQIPALEHTTSQLANLLQNRNLASDSKENVHRILHESDKVKFTTTTAGIKQNMDMIQLCLNTVLQIQRELQAQNGETAESEGDDLSASIEE